MARNRTLSEMRTEVWDRADVTSGLIPTTEVDSMINGSLAELFDLILEADPDWYLDSSDLSVTAGTDTVALPSNFYLLRGADVLDGGNYYPLRRFNFAERSTEGSSTDKRSTRYRLMGANIRLSPTPGWSGTVRVYFTPAPPILTTATPGTSDVWNGWAGWEEYAIVDACLKIAIKQEEDAAPLLAQKKLIRARIRTMAGRRDQCETDRVRDVYGFGYSDPVSD